MSDDSNKDISYSNDKIRSSENDENKYGRNRLDSGDEDQ
jgi:hypothetical protein